MRKAWAMLAASMLLGLALASPVAASRSAAPTTSGPALTAAAAPKIAIIVGATEATTATYISYADAEYAEAIKYTPNVVKVYSPYATWAAVQSAVDGAAVVIYHGHGNGWPAPYPWDPTYATRDGFGLNATAGNGDDNNTYYGEPFVSTLHFAPNAIVLLHNLCYASGNSEPGNPEPTVDVAEQRVDNYGAGFLAAGAKAVIADGHASAIGYLRRLFTVDETLLSNWRNQSDYHGNEFSFASSRTPGAVAAMDPDYPTSGFYRSIIGALDTRSTDVTGSTGTVTPPTYSPACNGVNIRTGPSTSYGVQVQLGTSAIVTVSGTVAGGSWSTYCPTSKAGSSWYVIATINGSSVSALYGVSALYAATGVLVQNSSGSPTPTPTPTPTPAPTPTPTPAPPSTSAGTPACASINLRSSTSTSSGIVAQLTSGDSVTIDATLGGGSWSTYCPTAKSGSSWYRIVAVNGQAVSSRYGVSPVYAATGVITITTSSPPPSTSTYTPACDGVNIRSSASTSGTILTRLGLGASVTVTGSVGGGAWSTYCPTAKSGSSWFTVSAINGTPVSSLFGLGVVYAATGVLAPQ